MKHTDNHDGSVPLTNLFASLPLFSDLPVIGCERSGTIAETADIPDETFEWPDAATHIGIFRSYLSSGATRRSDLRIDTTLTTPAGDVVAGDALIDALYHQEVDERTGGPQRKVIKEPPLEITEMSLPPSSKSADVSIVERTDEFVHARGTTQFLERDVRILRSPIGVLSVDTKLRLDDETKPSAEYGRNLTDKRAEPLDSSTIDTAEVGRTVAERLSSTFHGRTPINVVFDRGGDGSGQHSRRNSRTRTFADLEVSDSDVSQTPFSVETTVVTVRGTSGLQPPADGADDLPSHVALVEIHLIGPENIAVDAAAEATIWIPLWDAGRSNHSHSALAKAVTHHAVEQYEWSAYRGETDDLRWHVWDPEEHTYAEVPAPTGCADGSIARTHERPDGDRLVCPITDTDAYGITRVRPCEIGVIDVSCHTRLYRPSVNRVLGPVHDGRQNLYAPLWTHAAWYSRQLADAIAERSNGFDSESLRLARRV
ncbi:hypothetical protein [Salinigranum halophilum]|uniref:hypothetical protein n=1 Tax=Salinigranum halophilum TaxID=2565931 RepID=UPI00115CE69D|nr:hypothetical protein [Salinigranum halophilum]